MVRVTTMAPYNVRYSSAYEYLPMSNCVFNFYFLALIVFGIIWGSKFTLGGSGPYS